MADQISNDHDIPRVCGTEAKTDAHGLAALLLVESLIHGLLARSVISVAEAVEILETAAEVNSEMAEVAEVPATMLDSLSRIEAIRTSLQNDLPET